ncbi:MAG TPA: sodium/proline symporter [Gemmatimonadetes bacterium]|jgi:sodium/proline symporter|nr:sodium/proline symporter [Gemmatimonadota bacterium]HIB08315.1 sodium/proline symporter [Gemmatimonadota bacterium]HIN77400.1 sodium/proline symporter [Gemmatimonadota bacterium]
MTSTTIISVLVGYLLILLGIGVWGSKESGDLKGYYVAGKRLPAWVIAFSSNATGESAWLLLGLTGMGYAIGVHAFWVILGEVLGVASAWVWVARPFKEYTDRFDSITVPDYLTDRFRDTSHVFRWISALIILSMVMAYTAAQLTGSGKAFDSFLGTGYTEGVWIGLGIVLFYTTVGGFKAVAYSDFLQGVLMLGCLLTLPFVGIAAAGGWSEMIAGLEAADPALLRPMGQYGVGPAGIASAVGFVAIGFAFLGSPQLLTRFMAARDQKQIIEGGFWAVLCVIGFDVGAVLGGMSGRTLFPGLADPETILPEMSAALFPAFFTGVFLVVVLAAIMSTVDSLLLLASSAVVRDILQKAMGIEASERTLSNLARAVTVVIGAVGLLVALTEPRAIFYFVLFAWSGIACAFTPVVICSLFWKRTTKPGAVAGMIGGFVVTVVWTIWFKERFFDLYEMVPGFIVGFACTIVVSLMTDVDRDTAAELDSVREAVGPVF